MMLICNAFCEFVVMADRIFTEYLLLWQAKPHTWVGLTLHSKYSDVYVFTSTDIRNDTQVWGFMTQAYRYSVASDHTVSSFFCSEAKWTPPRYVRTVLDSY